MKKRKKCFIDYDYEKAYAKQLENMHEWFVEQMLKRGKRTQHALKEISSGEQLEIEIYPQFRRMDEVPEEGRRKKDNSQAQKNLNDKNARKYVERLINQNFDNDDLWITLTYDEKHLPPDGDMNAAIKNVQNYIKAINRKRKQLGLPNAKYIYITEYSPYGKIRWHHHIIMDGALDRDIVEKMWKKGSRINTKRLEKDENGFSGLANYIVKEKDRLKSEKRWNSSQGLIKPGTKVVHSKKDEEGIYRKIERYVKAMVQDRNEIERQCKSWYPDYTFTSAEVYYNEFNCMFYIHARMRKEKKEGD